ncbi:MAG: toll/interleukin-1 receptor domain-containing protein [Calothrix sp. FI2-JRJ7]|nr:toll/interleukin-1 receptor domain-containing protein [Calothrix sp. FI2-JRJ7]
MIRESDLDINLEEIVFGENLNDVVFELINWAESHNKLDALVKAAYQENPNNAKLRAFVNRKLETEHSPKSSLKLQKGEIALQSQFDVFLCHNSQDKPEVQKIGNQLIELEIRPWLDAWQLRPGFPWQPELERQVKTSKSVALFVGSSGLGPWQKQEIEAFMREFVERKCPVIPVLLPTAPDKPELPVFLSGHMWVDFRQLQPEPMKQLIWGITGKNLNGI